jgi:O-antigen/teichoic acid export membrane protein
MKYFKNTSWLFVEKILRMVVGLFVGIWVARYLGPEQFGLFSYAQSFVGLFTAIATLGLDGIVVRELVKNESRRDELIGTAFWLKFMGAFGVLIILAIAVNFTSNNMYTNTLIFIIASATVFQSFNVLDFYFQSKVLSKYVVYTNIISLFISSIVKIILILNEASLIAFAWVVLFDSLVLAFGLIYFYIKNNSKFKIQNSKFSKPTAVALLKDSWPLIFAGIAISINMRVDQVMLQEFLGSESVGYYAVSVKIMEVLAFVPHMISKSIFPLFVSSYKHNKELFVERMGKAYKYLFYGSTLLALFLYLTSEYIIKYSFGNQYFSSIELLQIYSIAIVFASIGAANAIYLKVTNMQKKIMNRQIINVILNISMNYYFIQQYGVVGSVYATLIALFISTIAYDLFDKSLNEMNKMKLSILKVR